MRIFNDRLTIDCIMIMVSKSILGNNDARFLASRSRWRTIPRGRISSSSQFRLTFRSTLSSIGFFAGLSNGPDIDRTRDRSRTWRRNKRPISATTTTTREPTTMQITASVSVWAIGCPFFAMKKAIRPP